MRQFLRALVIRRENGPAGDDGLGRFAVVADGFGLRVAKADEIDRGQVVVHDQADHSLAFALSRLSDQDLTQPSRAASATWRA